MIIYTVTGDDGTCLFLQIFLKRNISFFVQMRQRQKQIKGKISN